MNEETNTWLNVCRRRRDKSWFGENHTLLTKIEIEKDLHVGACFLFALGVLQLLRKNSSKPPGGGKTM